MDQTHKLLSRLAELEDSRSSINRDIKALRRVAREALTTQKATPFVPHVVVRPKLLPTIPLRQQLFPAPASTPASVPGMPPFVRLSQPQSELAEARQKFLTDMANEKEKQKSFAILIPELEHLWRELLPRFATEIPPFDHYLTSYTPQLLTKAIKRMYECTEDYLDRVVNPKGYFRSILHSLRMRELAKAGDLPGVPAGTSINL